MTVWVLGDQLSVTHGPLARHPDDPVLFVEAAAFARRRPYHPHKLVLVFAAMRHLRDELRAAGRTVEYHQVETFGEGLDRHFERHPGDELVLMEPPSHGAAERLAELVEARGGTLEVAENELFVCPPDRFDAWADGREPPYRHEPFYRMLRRETGYLMDGDEPVGGAWNFDAANRAFPGASYEPPSPRRFEPDEATREVVEWVAEAFGGTYDTTPAGGDWADPVEFDWPVTRDEALDALADFCARRLAGFGPFQDAMLGGSWAMHHSLLSPALNVGLLHPAEVVETAIEVAEADDEIPLASLEGFVRQVLGWREFVRHAYRASMPALASANQLEATDPLPDAYWDGETRLACLADVVETVRRRGYSHHIERLMVLSNVATLLGVDPAELNAWFHASHLDAFHWVTTPNVVEMGAYGAGVFATKPYVASANYVDRMSDHCPGCHYDAERTLGEGACPLNALYWDFLGRNESRLRSNPRMGLMYHHWDGKDEAERQAIRERADEVRQLARDGEL